MPNERKYQKEIKHKVKILGAIFSNTEEKL